MTDGAMRMARAADGTLQLLAALRLASPALPIGGFSYSQGLENAIERGAVRGEADVLDWLRDLLTHVLARFEAPLVLALAEAVAAGDAAETRRLHALYVASRETAELRAETAQMGFSLQRLVDGLPEGGHGAAAEALDDAAESIVALPLAWAHAARAFGLPPQPALASWLWAWLENQVAAAIKAVPLGQQAGQRLLSALTPVLAAACQTAARLPERDWSNFAPGLAMASSWHETQYTRIFRS